MKQKEESRLKQALLELEQEELEQFLAQEDEAWEPSPAFRKKLKRILPEKKTAQEKQRPVYSRVGWRRLVLVTAVIIALAATTLCVEAIRTPVMHFFLQFTEEGAELVPKEDSCVSLPSCIRNEYRPTVLPEDFIRIRSAASAEEATTVWADGEGRMIRFRQGIVMDGEMLRTGSGSLTAVPELGGDGYAVQSEDQFTLLWVAHGYVFRLDYPAELGWEQCLECAQSVALRSETK